MSKLPYIPDKNLYAAVMGACSWIREDGYFNKAVNYYAKKYDVSADDVAKYVRIAQGNGQRKANKRNPRKYFWYAIEYSVDESEGCYADRDAKYSVLKATSKRNAQNQLPHNSPLSFHEAMSFVNQIEEFENQEQAKECCIQWDEERKDRMRGIYKPEYWEEMGIAKD